MNATTRCFMTAPLFFGPDDSLLRGRRTWVSIHGAQHMAIRELNLDDAPDRLTALDGTHRHRHLVSSFEALIGPSTVLHVGRITRFHDPVHDLPVVTFDVELEKR